MITAQRTYYGFMLIELIVVIAVSSIVLSLALTSYGTFKERQTLKEAGNLLLTNLRFAQSQAFAGVKDCGPTVLLGWVVKFANSYYEIHSRCEGAIGTLKRVALTSGTELTVSSGIIEIRFQPVNKDVLFFTSSGSALTLSEVTITLTKGSNGTTVIVGRGGEIQ